jgi:hypothetical protein
MSDDDRLGDLLELWEELHQDGHEVSAEELCGDSPQLLAALRQRIDALRAMDAVLGEKKKPEGTVSTGHSEPSVARPPARSGAEAANRPGIAGYEILGELGRGGMGVVYQARHLKLNRVVALKMILAGAQAGPRDLARFRTEVEAVARLQHPNIVQVYEVGEHDGRPYFAMEFVDGGSLEQRRTAVPQPPRPAAQLLETLARTMHSVHQRGVVHRDLKPANVLMTADGTPKITDFGLAKRLDAEVNPTLSGHILGTPSYMAPEQAQARASQIGPGTDVHALGVILYELLTGRPPFTAATPWDTIRRVAFDEPVPPRRLQPRVPTDLETICLRCLQKEPERRYGSAEDLAEDLRRFLAGEPIRARPVGLGMRALKWAKRRSAPAALLVVSCLAVVALTVGAIVHTVQLQKALGEVNHHAEESRQRLVRLHVAQGAHSLEDDDWFGALVWFAEALRLDEGREDREEMHRVRIAAVLRQCPRPVQLWFHDGPVWHAAFSPDGRQVLTTGEDGTAHVWDVGTGEAVGPPLRHKAAIWPGAFSPDGRSVVTAGRDGTARVWDATTGRSLTLPLSHDGPLTCAFFSPDGRSILTAAEDSTARIWEAATGEPRTGPLKHEGAVKWAEFSPDGRLVVTAGDDGKARVWHAGSGESATAPQTPLLRHNGTVWVAAFSPEGQSLVVTAGNDGTVRLWDVAPGRHLLPPTRVLLRRSRTRRNPGGG